MKKILLSLSALSLLATGANAQQKVATEGNKNVIVHEGTGTWCGWCVDGALKLDAMTTNPKVIGVAVHNQDAMAFADGNTYNSTYATGYPFGTVDCSPQNLDPNYPNSVGFRRAYWQGHVDARLAEAPKFDLEMTHTFENGQVSATVTATPLEDMSGDYSLNVYVVQDNMTGSGAAWDQKNFYHQYPGAESHPYYSKPALIVGYVHNKVLRAMLGGTWGEEAATDPKKDESFSKTFSGAIANPEDAADIRLVAVVQKKSSVKTDRQVYNAVEAQFHPWTTSVSNIAQVANVSIAPNPANNYISVKAFLTQAAEANITITNMVGQTAFTKDYAKNSLVSEQISVANFTNGMYFVKVTSNGQSYTQKVIVNK